MGIQERNLEQQLKRVECSPSWNTLRSVHIFIPILPSCVCLWNKLEKLINYYIIEKTDTTQTSEQDVLKLFLRGQRPTLLMSTYIINNCSMYIYLLPT